MNENVLIATNWAEYEINSKKVFDNLINYWVWVERRKIESLSKVEGRKIADKKILF